MAVRLSDRIIPELDLTFGDAVRTSQAKSSDNLPESQAVEENIRNLARKVLLPLKRNFPGFSASWINSWYRNPTVNEAVGGAASSNHLTGNAVDISVDGNIASRRANADIFYFLWDYFESTRTPFNELIWEVKDSGFAASPESRMWPQWVHVSVRRQGANKGGVSSVGVDKDFDDNPISQGLSNSGRGRHSLDFLEQLDNDAFYQKFRAFSDFSDISQEPSAKALQTAFTYLRLEGRLQLDYVSTDIPFSQGVIEGTFMRLRDSRLSQFLSANGLRDLSSEVDQLLGLPRASKEFASRRKDKAFLASIAKSLNSRKLSDAQFSFFYDGMSAVMDRFFPSIKEPYALILALKHAFQGGNLSDLLLKEEIPTVTTDGSWIDYHTRAAPDSPISRDLRKLYQDDILDVGGPFASNIFEELG